MYSIGECGCAKAIKCMPPAAASRDDRTRQKKGKNRYEGECVSIGPKEAALYMAYHAWALRSSGDEPFSFLLASLSFAQGTPESRLLRNGTSNSLALKQVVHTIANGDCSFPFVSFAPRGRRAHSCSGWNQRARCLHCLLKRRAVF